MSRVGMAFDSGGFRFFLFWARMEPFGRGPRRPNSLGHCHECLLCRMGMSDGAEDGTKWPAADTTAVGQGPGGRRMRILGLA